MKKITILFLLTLNFVSFSQCPMDNTLYGNFSIPTVGGSQSTAFAWGGDLYTLDVITGSVYEISTCSSSSFDSEITLYDNTGSGLLGYNDDSCGLQSFISYTATYTGQINILIDEYGCLSNTTDMELVVTWVSSLNSQSFTNNEFLIYPNPTSDILNFSNLNGEQITTKIYDINGRLLISNSTDENLFTIDVKNLKTGIYQIEMKSDTKTFTKKIIKN